MFSPYYLSSPCLIFTCTKTNKPWKNWKISTMRRRPDSTLDQRNIVIGKLNVGMFNKQVARHFQTCVCTIFSHRNKVPADGQCEKSTSCQQTRREDIDNVTSHKRNRLLSNTRIPDLVRNAPVTRICDKTIPKITVIHDYAGVAHTLLSLTMFHINM